MNTRVDTGNISTATQVRLLFSLLLVLGAILVIQSVFTPIIPKVIVTSIESSRATSSKEIVRGDYSKKQVIFTFDGGSGAQSAQAILNILAKHKVKGTFFLTGKFVEANQGIVFKIVSAGHEIFNHTYDHPHLSALSDKEIVRELDRMEKTLRSVAGISTAPYFRAPFGDRDQKVLRAAYKAGYQSVYWSVDAGDWQETEGKTAAEVRNTILSNLYPGAIYLMHLGDNITAEILDDTFYTIESRGYKIVSLSQGL